MQIAAVGVISLALVAGATAVASAVVQPNGSDAALYSYDSNIALVTDPSTVFTWTSDNFGSGSKTNAVGPSTCPTAADDAYIFVATAGNERTKAAWSAYGDSAFAPGTKDVIAATLTPGVALTSGNYGTVKSNGGTYSLGIACTNNNGNTIVGAFYRTASITAGTGSYTMSAVTEGTPPPPPANTDTTGSVALSPQTVGANDGVLSLSVPVGAAAVFAAPTLVNNKSTTTGTLGNVTVADGRSVTRKGWDLNASVTDFVNASDNTNTISKAQLGLIPKVVSSEATGVTVGPVQVAGSATYSSLFASGAAANTVGNTVLNADLTFVAPANKAAGTYVSTLTLTVVSK
ncbi:hypothetical protein [Cryobacterium ruanii]|uniref:WxL domain-containing protein n=1 Tax=Cryobacterium ruanii TaxID=1259197 RepID=A0A4R9ASS5_9MICO|nr:hypothetical protein [Cryobacterium ruanii]TFD68750.1 hypothetical protein E3T47_01875 [Cryobacterium ruanii]